MAEAESTGARLKPCAFDGCEADALKGELCPGHLKQRQRGQPLTALRRRSKSPLERLTEAAIAYADASDASEDAFARARDNLRKAAAACGLRIGRPRKVDPEVVARVLKRAGGILQAARALGVSRNTVKRALARH